MRDTVDCEQEQSLHTMWCAYRSSSFVAQNNDKIRRNVVQALGVTMPLVGAAEMGYVAMGVAGAAVNGLTSIGFDEVTYQNISYAKTAEDSTLRGP